MALQIAIAAGPSVVPRTGPRCRFLAVGDGAPSAVATPKVLFRS
jgi:hypothetical protein